MFIPALMANLSTLWGISYIKLFHVKQLCSSLCTAKFIITLHDVATNSTFPKVRCLYSDKSLNDLFRSCQLQPLQQMPIAALMADAHRVCKKLDSVRFSIAFFLAPILVRYLLRIKCLLVTVSCSLAGLLACKLAYSLACSLACSMAGVYKARIINH